MRSLIVFLLYITISTCQEGAQYLQNAVRDLRQLPKASFQQDLRRVDKRVSPPESKDAPEQYNYERYNEEVPPLSLTKGELAAIYDNAVSKGETLKLNTGDNTFVHAAVHELGEGGEPSNHYESGQHGGELATDDTSGYYYYYYPIKSFIDEMTSQDTSHDYTFKPRPTRPKELGTTERPRYQYHSHHHQHNITINKAMAEEKKQPKILEPLFMAISGFIGMAITFLISVLFMSSSSKFSFKPGKPWNKKDDSMKDFARLALNAIDGQCAEKFACEWSKNARNLNIQDNRFVKLLKRIAPGTFGKYMDKVGKYTHKQLRCTAIPCKKKNSTPPKNKNQTKKSPVRRKH